MRATLNSKLPTKAWASRQRFDRNFSLCFARISPAGQAWAWRWLPASYSFIMVRSTFRVKKTAARRFASSCRGEGTENGKSKIENSAESQVSNFEFRFSICGRGLVPGAHHLRMSETADRDARGFYT